MEAQYKLKYALQNLKNLKSDHIIGKVKEIMDKDGLLDGDNQDIFDSVSSYIDEVDEQSRMLYKELGPYRLFHSSPLKSDSAKVDAFSESVELICGLAPEKVSDMLKLVEKINNTSSTTQTMVEHNKDCILVKKVMRRILPEHQ